MSDCNCELLARPFVLVILDGAKCPISVVGPIYTTGDRDSMLNTLTDLMARDLESDHPQLEGFSYTVKPLRASILTLNQDVAPGYMGRVSLKQG